MRRVVFKSVRESRREEVGENGAYKSCGTHYNPGARKITMFNTINGKSKKVNKRDTVKFQ